MSGRTRAGEKTRLIEEVYMALEVVCGLCKCCGAGVGLGGLKVHVMQVYSLM